MPHRRTDSPEHQWIRTLNALLLVGDFPDLEPDTLSGLGELEDTLVESLYTAQEEDDTRLDEVLEVSRREEEDRQLALAIERSIEDQRKREAEAWERAWDALRGRYDAVHGARDLPDGLALLQEATRGEHGTVMDWLPDEPAQALVALPDLEGAIETFELMLQQYREARAAFAKAADPILRRYLASGLAAATVESLAEPYGATRLAFREMEGLRAERDYPGATAALTELDKAVGTLEEALAARARDLRAWEKRREYVAGRIEKAKTHAPLTDTLTGGLDTADELVEAGRIPDALKKLDELINAVRGQQRKLSGELADFHDSVWFEDLPLAGKGLPGASPPVGPGHWQEAVKAALGEWDVTTAAKLLQAYKDDVAAARKSLPRQSTGLGDLSTVQDKHNQLKLQNDRTARNTEQARSVATRIISSDGTLVIDLGPFRDMPFTEPDDIESVLEEISRSDDVDLPQSQHALQMLRRLADPDDPRSKRMRETLDEIDLPPEQDSAASRMIRATLGLDPDVDVTAAHAKQAAVATLLSQVRQGGVGSCFATATAVEVQRTRPDKLLEDLKELFSTGGLTRTLDGETIRVDLNEDMLPGGLSEPTGVPRKDSTLHTAPGMSAGLEALGVDPDDHEAALKQAADDIRFEKGLKAGIALIDDKWLKEPKRSAVYDRALADLRNPDTVDKDIRKALKRALDAEGVKFTSMPDHRSGKRRHGERMQTVLDGIATFDDLDQSDDLKPDELLARVAKLQDAEDELALAQDAFLAQEDNRLMRAWEYSIASMVEKGPYPYREALITGAEAAAEEAMNSILAAVKSEVLDEHEDRVVPLAQALLDAFGGHAESDIDSRYDPSVKGPPAKDGKSSTGGYCLFYDGKKVTEKTAYTEMIKAIFRAAHATAHGSAVAPDKGIAELILAKICGEAGKTAFLDKAKQGTGRPEDVAQPWMVAAGGSTDTLLKLYNGVDGDMSSTSCTKGSLSDGGDLLEFLVGSLQGMKSKLEGPLAKEPWGSETAIPVKTVGVHAFSLRPGSPFLKASVSSEDSPEEITRALKSKETARLDARKGAALTPEIKKTVLTKYFGSSHEDELEWIMDERNPSTVEELIAGCVEYSEWYTTEGASDRKDEVYALSDLTDTSEAAIEERVMAGTDRDQRQLIYDELLSTHPDPDPLILLVEGALPPNPPARMVVAQVMERLKPPTRRDKQRSASDLNIGGLQVRNEQERQRRKTGEVDETTRPGLYRKLLAGIPEEHRDGYARILDRQVPDGSSVGELFAAFDVALGEWANDNADKVAEWKDKALEAMVPLHPAGVRQVVGMIYNTLGSDMLDAYAAVAGETLGDPTTIAALTELAPRLPMLVATREQSLKVGELPDLTPLTSDRRDGIYNEALDGYTDWYREDVRKRVEKDPQPKTIAKLVSKINSVIEADEETDRERAAFNALTSPELGVVAEDELSATIDKLLVKLSVPDDDCEGVRDAALRLLSGDTPAPLAKVQAAVKTALGTESSGLGLPDQEAVSDAVTKALKALGVDERTEKAVLERAVAMLYDTIPATPAAIRSAVAWAIQLDALTVAVDAMLDELDIRSDRRFAVRHQAVLDLERRDTIDKAAIQDAIAKRLDAEGIDVETEALKRSVGSHASKHSTDGPAVDELETLGGSLDQSNEEAMHEAMLKAVPPPGVVIADTNWGNGDTQTMFSVGLDPVSGDLELFEMNSDGSGLHKADKDTWVSDPSWRVFDDPDQYGGLD